MTRLLLGSALLVALASLTSCGDGTSTTAPDGTSEAALALSADLQRRYADDGKYPEGRNAVKRLLDDGALGQLPAGNRVHTYSRLTQQPGFLLCIVNDARGTFAFVDSTREGVFDQGTIEPGTGKASFDVECSPTLIDPQVGPR